MNRTTGICARVRELHRHGYSVDEIARLTGRKSAVVRNILHRKLPRQPVGYQHVPEVEVCRSELVMNGNRGGRFVL